MSGDHTEETLTAAILKTWGGVSSQGSGIRYVVALQVHNGAGFDFRRRLDAVVFDTWPSTGLALHGIEVKCSKSDLRRELQNPDKASEFFEYLDNFSIVAPAGIVDRDLIPKRWGIYTPTPEGALRAMRKPLYLHDDQRDRKVVNRSVMAAFSRALVQRSLSREARDLAYQEGYRNAEKSAERDRKDFEEFKEKIVAFEEASGVSVGTYFGDGKSIGEAVRFVREGGLRRQITYAPDIRHLGQRLVKMADELDSLATSLDPEVSP